MSSLLFYGLSICGFTITCAQGFLRPHAEGDQFGRILGNDDRVGSRNQTGGSPSDSQGGDGEIPDPVGWLYFLTLFFGIYCVLNYQRIKWWWKLRKFYRQDHPFYFILIKRAGLSVVDFMHEDTMSGINRIMRRLYWTRKNGDPLRVDKAIVSEEMEEEELRILANTLAKTLLMNDEWEEGKKDRLSPSFWLWTRGNFLEQSLTVDRDFLSSVRVEWRTLFHKEKLKDCGNLEDVPSTCIFREEFEIGEKIVEGGFGAVHMGQWEGSGEQIAVKMLGQLEGSAEDATTQQWPSNEANVQLQLNHPNVLTLYGYCSNPETPSRYLLMEYQPKGSLRKVLDNEELGWSTKEQIMIEIAEGLAYLHKENVVHGDMKSLNILLDDEYHAKLCDFGLSRTLPDTSVRYSGDYHIGSHRWISPEAFTTGEKEGWELRSIDIYALGLIIWELCTGDVPKTKCDVHDPDEFPDEGYPPNYVKLAQACYRKDPMSRPSADEVAKQLRKASEDKFRDLFPEGIANSRLVQGNVHNCRHVASLYILKKNPLAPELFQRLITEKSKIDAGQNVTANGWRVYFAPPFDRRPVDVNEEDLRRKRIEGQEWELLRDGQPGDKVLLLAASRWRKKFGTTNSVHAGADTIFQGEHTHDPVEFFRLCLYGDIVGPPIDIYANSVYDSLSTLECCKLYDILSRFSDKPHSFLLTAGTKGCPRKTSANSGSLDATQPLVSKDGSPALNSFPTGHMYSMLRADKSERTVTLVDPMTEDNTELTLTYDTFLQEFRRLAGVMVKHQDKKS